jgi:glutamine cyclotransferase
MRFGHRLHRAMKYRYYLIMATSLLFAWGCGHGNEAANELSISPEAGAAYKAGATVDIRVHYPASAQPDSVVYRVDSVKVALKKDSAALLLPTGDMALGPRIITARVYKAGGYQSISTNIVLLATQAPQEYTYKVVKVFPHDTSSYTEGLQYQDGVLYESTGDYGQSTIRKSDLNTGKALQVTKLGNKYFGEGLSVIGDKIIQMTYREKVGFVYDKSNLKLLGTFADTVGVEGWGMCFDGQKLYLDDGTTRIWFLNKDTYRQTGYVDVYDDKQAINKINELEYIDGKLYANVYTTDTILVINPKTGAVLQRVDMKNIWPNSKRPAGFDYQNNVLNGIAWDEKGKRLFVTGKKWPYVYQVEFVKK